MIKHVSKLTKDNYSCKYYDENNIRSLTNTHHNSALKLIHLNISSLIKNGLEFTSYLQHLNINYDVIMLTEARETTVDIIKLYFPNFEIFLKKIQTAPKEVHAS